MPKEDVVVTTNHQPILSVRVLLCGGAHPADLSSVWGFGDEANRFHSMGGEREGRETLVLVKHRHKDIIAANLPNNPNPIPPLLEGVDATTIGLSQGEWIGEWCVYLKGPEHLSGVIIVSNNALWIYQA